MIGHWDSLTDAEWDRHFAWLEANRGWLDERGYTLVTAVEDWSQLEVPTEGHFDVASWLGERLN